jgi:twitching motility protein PilJ
MGTVRGTMPALTFNKLTDGLLAALLLIVLLVLLATLFVSGTGQSDGVDARQLTALKNHFDGLPQRLAALSNEPGSASELAALQQQAEQLRQQLDQLIARSEAGPGFFARLLNNQLFSISAVLIILILLGLLIRQRFIVRRRLLHNEQQIQESTAQNQRNQEAILRLLDEMGDLAEGDLTVQVSVTEDITGTIADSINYAIEALRDLVSTIKNTSVRIAEAAQETRQVTERLAKAGENQAWQIDASSKTVNQMAQSMDDVSHKMASSAEVAEKSVGIANEGGQRVRRTIQGMDAIREHIQETSKRIKRLGESSQEIGDIVALINDIADQTNILALNAAIQASAAGEAGRGFAVVADEVQRLAERSSNATRRIETLVKTIQADTNEAIISMDKSTSEVVNGAGLAEKAGEALEEIESVSARLAELISSISRAANQVTEMTSRVSTTMSSINALTAENSEGTVTTASYVAKLDQLAQELRQSVSGFRLPERS